MLSKPLLIASFATFGIAAMLPANAGEPRVDFKKQVQPILAKSCVGCHNKDNAKGGLDLSSKAGIVKGGVSGKPYRTGKASESLLIKRLKGQGGELMPYGGAPLKAAQIRAIAQWINEGARM